MNPTSGQADSKVDWSHVRAEFPSLREWTYLNTATYGLMPLRARKAAEGHFDRRDQQACQDFLEWFEDADEIRADVGKLIGSNGEDIAFTVNACTPLSFFLNGIDWKPGDKIVTLDHEFPNQYAFPRLLGSAGVELIELTRLNDPLPANTRAVIASTVSYTTGRRTDTVRLRELANAAGALYYLDGTQSIGALRFDVQVSKPDMLAVDAYKWLMSPNGAGFFYVSPELRRTLTPTVVGWRSDREWRSVSSLHNGAPRFSERAERYEGGMIAFPSIYAMGACVHWLLELGPESVEQQVLRLSACAGEVLKRSGADILQEGGNILSAGWPGRDMTQLLGKLKEHRILAGLRLGRLRLSTHFYNSETEIDRLSDALI